MPVDQVELQFQERTDNAGNGDPDATRLLQEACLAEQNGASHSGGFQALQAPSGRENFTAAAVAQNPAELSPELEHLAAETGITLSDEQFKQLYLKLHEVQAQLRVAEEVEQVRANIDRRLADLPKEQEIPIAQLLKRALQDGVSPQAAVLVLEEHVREARLRQAHSDLNKELGLNGDAADGVLEAEAANRTLLDETPDAEELYQMFLADTRSGRTQSKWYFPVHDGTPVRGGLLRRAVQLIVPLRLGDFKSPAVKEAAQRIRAAGAEPF